MTRSVRNERRGFLWILLAGIAAGALALGLWGWAGAEQRRFAATSDIVTDRRPLQTIVLANAVTAFTTLARSWA
jgi:hypothetical protein